MLTEPTGDRDADHAVTAHAQVSGVVEEDDGSGTVRICRIEQERAHQNVGAARLAQDSAPIVVVVAAQAFKPLSERAGAEVGKAGEYTAGGLSRGV
jgi:hypothetical protein